MSFRYPSIYRFAWGRAACGHSQRQKVVPLTIVLVPEHVEPEIEAYITPDIIGHRSSPRARSRARGRHAPCVRVRNPTQQRPGAPPDRRRTAQPGASVRGH
eukprot:scaffold19750_cov69-Phaeocystis_antarctica.AAC.3